VPETLVNQEMERRLHDLAHRLEEQGSGMTIPQYLAATGQDQAQFIARCAKTATLAVRADLALRAVIAQEGIAATEEMSTQRSSGLAERLEEKPAKLRRDLETARGARGGTLGHRTREGAGIPERSRRSGRYRWQPGRSLLPDTEPDTEPPETVDDAQHVTQKEEEPEP